VPQCHPTLARAKCERFLRPIPNRPYLGSEALWSSKVPHRTTTFFPLPAADISTTNSMDVVEGTRECSELSRRIMPQITGDRDLRFGGAGVRSHHSRAGCSWLEEVETRRKDEHVSQLRKAPLPRRGCAHGRPSLSMEQRTSRRTRSPPEANQTLDVWPRQIRSASTPRRKCRMKSSPFKQTRTAEIPSPKVTKKMCIRDSQ